MAGEARNSCCPAPKPRLATWTPEIHKIFIDLCVERSLKYGYIRGNWKSLSESFQKNSGLMYGKKQLKNRWDKTKEQWKVWHKLTGTSSMGWDPTTATFNASDDDWANYTKENPKAAQFRFKGLLYAQQLDTIFDSPAISTPTTIPITTCPESTSERPPDAVESTTTDHSSPGTLTYSIGECIECLDGTQEIQPGGDLYLFALHLFLNKEYREIFLSLKRSSVRTAWLQRLKSAATC